MSAAERLHVPEAPKSGPRALAAPSTDEVATFLPLVQQCVARFMGKLPPNVLRDDLVAAGTYGLIDSLRKNGAERGPTFEWYARIRIRGAILDELRSQDWLSRRARSRFAAAHEGSDRTAAEKASVVGLDDLPVRASQIEDDSVEDPLTAAIRASDRARLAEAIASLPDRERTIVSMHYYQGEQFKTIAAELGVSEPRISQLHARAVTLLRKAMSGEVAVA